MLDTVLNEEMFRRGGDRYHTVYQYRHDIWKIVQFYRDVPRFGPGPREKQQHHDKKLDATYSRAKRELLELALCNPWDYFVTFTLDETKQDRFDLDAWGERFKQWIRDQRKKGLQCSFLLVPEQHKDGAWHAHGLMRGNFDLVPFRDMAAAGVALPDRVRNSDFFNWPLYQEKFGFCSFGLIRNVVASCFYITKYISKDMSRCVQAVGKHLYWASRDLIHAQKFGTFVNRDPNIDAYLVNKYDFCATGMIQPAEGWNPYFAGDVIEMLGGSCATGAKCFDILDLMPNQTAPSAAETEADAWAQFEQTVFM